MKKGLERSKKGVKKNKSSGEEQKGVENVKHRNVFLQNKFGQNFHDWFQYSHFMGRSIKRFPCLDKELNRTVFFHFFCSLSTPFVLFLFLLCP